jgi:hypothetical protein
MRTSGSALEIASVSAFPTLTGMPSVCCPGAASAASADHDHCALAGVSVEGG